MKLLTVAEATEKANATRERPITEKCVWAWVYRGKIPHIKVGSAVMIMETELEKFLSKNSEPSKLLDPVI